MCGEQSEWLLHILITRCSTNPQINIIITDTFIYPHPTLSVYVNHNGKEWVERNTLVVTGRHCSCFDWHKTTLVIDAIDESKSLTEPAACTARALFFVFLPLRTQPSASVHYYFTLFVSLCAAACAAHALNVRGNGLLCVRLLFQYWTELSPTVLCGYWRLATSNPFAYIGSSADMRVCECHIAR